MELIRTVGPKVRHGWVTFDEAYGKDPGFLSGLEELEERYIGEVPKNFRGWLRRPEVEEPKRSRSGKLRGKPRVRAGEPQPQTVEEIAAGLPSSAWKRLKFREGTKGPQMAHFAAVRMVAERDDLPGPELWLMIERSCDQAPYVKYYVSNAAPDCPLLKLAQAGHNRWPTEDCFLRGKQEVGLDDYEVRGWRGWHHHMTLVMLAFWFLVLQGGGWGEKTETGMTLPDVRRLLQVIFAPEYPRRPVKNAIRLSEWRQDRNEIASNCHTKAKKRRLRNTG